MQGRKHFEDKGATARESGVRGGKPTDKGKCRFALVPVNTLRFRLRVRTLRPDTVGREENQILATFTKRPASRKNTLAVSHTGRFFLSVSCTQECFLPECFLLPGTLRVRVRACCLTTLHSFLINTGDESNTTVYWWIRECVQETASRKNRNCALV